MFSVGLPVMPSTLRGVSDSNVVPMARDIIRHQIDAAKVTPRIINEAINPINVTTNVIKGLKNRGYDSRKLVEEARNKLSHNKAKSSFMDTPFVGEFMRR